MNNSILIRWDTFHINHRLLREERVGRQARHQIDREADDGPVSGVLDLRDVLKLTVDGLDQSPLAQEDFVRDCHKLALHVALKLCYQLDAVHETDARAGSHAASIHEQDEGDHHLTLQLDEAVVGNEPRERIRHIPAYLIQVEVFKAFISAQMEQYHDGYHLGVGQPAVPMIPPLRLVPLGGKSVDIDKSVIYSAEVIRHTENFSNFVIVDRHSESLCFLFFQIYKNFRYFPNIQSIKFH